MRIVQTPQMIFGEANIADIRINPKSRDDIPAILLGLQYIYITPDIRERVFKILQQVLPTRTGKHLTEEQRTQKANPNRGRPGMEQWRILVLGVLRLGLNTDYDRVHELANHHNTIRKMLGHDGWEDNTEYSLQSIKDNLSLFTPEILDQINQEVVNAGHTLVKKSPSVGQTKEVDSNSDVKALSEEEKLRGRCDSFVVETNVHFPTDINLLYDAVRKMIQESATLAEQYEIAGWRQYDSGIKKFKSQYRAVQQMKHSNSKDEKKSALQILKIQEAHKSYIEMGARWLEKSEETLNQISALGVMNYETLYLKQYQQYTRLLSNQIHRRVVLGEKIPHSEKIFSIFEPHTEWISKGKAGVPVELGLRVCILEDQHQFILHHKVMEKETDDKVAIEMITESQTRFPQLMVSSFDKGFHSPSNQETLNKLLELNALPKKGRLSKADKAREGSEEFKKHRRQHSAVESAINALEQHGLDVCPDHGIGGFKRYVALAVVGRNIHRLGSLVRKQQIEKERRKRGPYKKTA